MKLKKWYIICLFVLFGYGNTKAPIYGQNNNIKELYQIDMEQNSFDLYFLEYLKQRINMVDIIKNINKLMEARNMLTNDDEKNYWDLCVIEGITQNIDIDVIIDIASNIIKIRNEYEFIDVLEKNFIDMCVYELLKIKYGNDIKTTIDNIILARRNFNKNK
jgi:hypothetical protein